MTENAPENIPGDNLESKPYVLNLEVIKNNNEFPHVIRALASHLQGNPFFTAGKFFEYISKNDLLEIKRILDNCNPKIDEKTHLFILESEQQEKDLYLGALLTFLLAFGEGESIISAKILAPAINNLQALVEAEYQALQGKVILNRKNYSVLDDGKVIATRIRRD